MVKWMEEDRVRKEIEIENEEVQVQLNEVVRLFRLFSLFY